MIQNFDFLALKGGNLVLSHQNVFLVKPTIILRFLKQEGLSQLK